MKTRKCIVLLFLFVTLITIASCKDSSTPTNNNECVKVVGTIENNACNITDTTSYTYNYSGCDGRAMTVTVVPSMACNAVSQTTIVVGSVLGGPPGWNILKLDTQRIAAWTVPNSGDNITTIANKYGLTVETIITNCSNDFYVYTTVNGTCLPLAILTLPKGHNLPEYLTSYGDVKPFCNFGNDSEIQFATPVYDIYGSNSTVPLQGVYFPITDHFQVGFTATDFTPPSQVNQELNVGFAFSKSTGNTVTWLLQATKQSPGNALDMVILYTSSDFVCGETDWQLGGLL